MARRTSKTPVVPENPVETPGQKAARTKHGKAALQHLLDAAKRMTRARISLNQITGIIGETWAEANLSMLSTNHASAAFDGWLPDGRTVEVKCRYVSKGSSTVALSPNYAGLVNLLLAMEINGNVEIEVVYFGDYQEALKASPIIGKDGKRSIHWAKLAALGMNRLS